MTSSGSRHGAQAARPEGDKQPHAAAVGEPPDQIGRRTFVVEIWASPQMRERNPGRPLSLREAIEAGREPAPSKDREPDPEPEAGP